MIFKVDLSSRNGGYQENLWIGLKECSLKSDIEYISVNPGRIN